MCDVCQIHNRINFDYKFSNDYLRWWNRILYWLLPFDNSAHTLKRDYHSMGSKFICCCCFWQNAGAIIITMWWRGEDELLLLLGDVWLNCERRQNVGTWWGCWPEEKAIHLKPMWAWAMRLIVAFHLIATVRRIVSGLPKLCCSSWVD